MNTCAPRRRSPLPDLLPALGTNPPASYFRSMIPTDDDSGCWNKKGLLRKAVRGYTIRRPWARCSKAWPVVPSSEPDSECGSRLPTLSDVAVGTSALRERENAISGALLHTAGSHKPFTLRRPRCSQRRLGAQSCPLSKSRAQNS